MKKIIAILLIALLFSGCQPAPKSQYNKYSESFFDTFNTLIRIVGYTKNEEEFNAYAEKIHLRFQELHRLYDIYNDYEGINNVKTINDNAGIKPVRVDKELIDLIIFSKDWYDKTGRKVNIAMGPVLRIWHQYREEGREDPENAKLPPMDKLLEAAKYTDLDRVIVDVENSTVYLEDKRMSLDVGAVAKGYAAELVAREIKAEGFNSAIINAGGNIRVLGKPLDGIRQRWGIGIQNPDKFIATEEENLLDTVFVNNASVVSSGDYQRYYIVDDKVLHHLIDPDTLMPGDYYRAMTVVTEDSGIADIISTAAFLMPYEQSLSLVESFKDVGAVWVMKDGRLVATEGMKKMLKSNGASGAKAE
jgi:FAD:protein FMN transferase